MSIEAEIKKLWDAIHALQERETIAVPQTITGTRDNPESALANLLTGLESAGVIVDSTTAS